MWARSETLENLSTDWHQFRINARRTAFSKEEFGEIEQIKYDLDTARITGKDNPRSYTVNRPIQGADGNMNNGVDVRTLDQR